LQDSFRDFLFDSLTALDRSAYRECVNILRLRDEQTIANQAVELYRDARKFGGSLRYSRERTQGAACSRAIRNVQQPKSHNANTDGASKLLEGYSELFATLVE
jgi:hypothetical protein